MKFRKFVLINNNNNIININNNNNHNHNHNHNNIDGKCTSFKGTVM